MKLRAHLQTTITAPKLVGQLSFQSFLQVASKFATFATDNLTLGLVNDRYKVYTCKVDPTKRIEFLAEVAHYKSMEGIRFWMDNAVPDNAPFSCYYSVFESGEQWWLDFGIALGADIYVIGKFPLNTANFKALTESALLKDFKHAFSVYDFRIHTLLNSIRNAMRFLDLDTSASITDACVIDNTVVVSIYNLGVWEKSGNIYIWQDADKYAKLYQRWVRRFGWWQQIELIVAPSKSKWVDFSIRVKI